MNIGSFKIFTSVKADTLFHIIIDTYRFAHNQERSLALSYCRISFKTQSLQINMHVEYQISLICFKFDICNEKGFTFFSNFDFVEKVWNWKGEY